MEHRLDHIDAIRAFAAVSVLVEHFYAAPSIASGHTWAQSVVAGLDLGRIGVVVFFLISGFVIPFSLKKNRHLGDFWVKRVTRLYPAYWMSLILAVVLQSVVSREAIGGAQALANATMLQNFFHYENVLGVYWTLKLELVFYVMAYGLFLFGLIDSAFVLAAISGGLFCVFLLYLDYWTNVTAIGHHIAAALHLGGAIASSTGTAGNHPIPGILNMNWGNFCAYFSAMFLGACLRRWSEGKLRTAGKMAIGLLCFGWLVLLPAMGIVCYRKTQDIGLFSMYGSWATALALFLLLAFVTPVRSKVLAWIGLCSYSLYLLHSMVIDLLLSSPPFAAPHAFSPLLTLVVCIAISLAVAHVSYFLVEKPAMRFGRSVARRLERGATT